MIFRFKYKGKNIKLDVEKYDNIFSQARGLMFRKQSKPLLFIFKKSKKRIIHSFFCKPFFAIWFNKGSIIDAKLINPWRFSIKPKGKFNHLLEVLINDPNFLLFADGKRNI